MSETKKAAAKKAPAAAATSPTTSPAVDAELAARNKEVELLHRQLKEEKERADKAEALLAEALRPVPAEVLGSGADADTVTQADLVAVVDALNAKDVTVRVPETDAAGKRHIVNREVRADDIMSFRIDGSAVHVTTCDGRKHEAVLV